MAKKTHGPVTLEVSDAQLRDVMGDLVRVDFSHRPFARAGSVVGIRHNGKRVFVVARGPAGVGKSGISMDQATRKELGLRPNDKAEFVFEKANFWGECVWAWKSTDAMPRIAARLGAISVGLGGIGLILGIISLLK